MKRYLESKIVEDLAEKMVFLGGPRQVGKTVLSLNLLNSNDRENHSDTENPAYLNWDIIENKELLLRGAIPGGESFIILDEIHKYKNWRNLVKGFYDLYKGKKILITGSARLDYSRRGGDSLHGRYHYYRLHPLSLHELNLSSNSCDTEQLLTFGGFPEPFLKGEEHFWKRWQRERQSRIIQEDLINLEFVKEVSSLDLLVQLLPSRVGSILSVNNLKQDLQVAYETVERWIQILENLYHCYRILPYGAPKIRAARKEKKLYMWDWSLCKGMGTRFENMVASHLLKYCHFIEDSQGDEMELRFIRDYDQREIDFVVLRNRQAVFAIECKTGETRISKHIPYFAKRTDIPLFYQVHLGKKDYEMFDIRTRVLPFKQLSQLLKL